MVDAFVISLDRVEISAERAVLVAALLLCNDDTSRLSAVESWATEVLRATVSADSPVLSAVSTTVRDEADALNVLDRAETATIRAEISLESMLAMDTCDCMRLVAKLVLPPIALANSESVSIADARLGPAMDAILTFTYDSVATRSSLILG